MGNESVSVVTDAGPIIHLAEIDCVHLLAVFGTLHIPAVVWQEILRHVRVRELDFPEKLLVRHHTFDPQKVQQWIAAHKLEHLHAGEQACFLLCHSVRISTLLTDDLAVRDSAKQHAITPVGSLGVLIRAYRKGLLDLPQTEHKMLALQNTSSLFVTNTVVELAIEQLRTYS